MGERNRTPAEIVLGYEIRHPLVTFSGGQEVVYHPSGRQPVKAEVIVQNSQRTMYVVKSNGDTVLAHIDQIKPAGDINVATDKDIGVNIDRSGDMLGNANIIRPLDGEVARRYPNRIRGQPDRYIPG